MVGISYSKFPQFFQQEFNIEVLVGSRREEKIAGSRFIFKDYPDQRQVLKMRSRKKSFLKAKNISQENQRTIAKLNKLLNAQFGIGFSQLIQELSGVDLADKERKRSEILGRDLIAIENVYRAQIEIFNQLKNFLGEETSRSDKLKILEEIPTDYQTIFTHAAFAPNRRSTESYGNLARKIRSQRKII